MSVPSVQSPLDFEALASTARDCAFVEDALQNAEQKVKRLGGIALVAQERHGSAIEQTAQAVRNFCEQDDLSNEQVMNIVRGYANAVGGDIAEDIEASLATSEKLRPGQYIYGWGDGPNWGEYKVLHRMTASPEPDRPDVLAKLWPHAAHEPLGRLSLVFDVWVEDDSQESGARILTVTNQDIVGNREGVLASLPSYLDFDRYFGNTRNLETFKALSSAFTALSEPAGANLVNERAAQVALSNLRHDYDGVEAVQYLREHEPELLERELDLLATSMLDTVDLSPEVQKYAIVLTTADAGGRHAFRELDTLVRQRRILDQILALHERAVANRVVQPAR